MAACRSLTNSLLTHHPVVSCPVATPYSPQALRALAAIYAPLHSGWAAADRQTGTGRRRAALGSLAVDRCIPLGETPPSPHPPAVGTLPLPKAHSNVCHQ